MGEEKKEKIVLSVYVSPRCKEKLECLQKLYAFAGTKFSLSKIVEDSIGILYAGAYLCRDSNIWKGFFQITKILDGEAANKGVQEAISIAQENKAIAENILSVPINLKEEMKKEIKKTSPEIKVNEDL